MEFPVYTWRLWGLGGVHADRVWGFGFPWVPYIRLDDGSIIMLVPEEVEIVEKHNVLLVKHGYKLALPRLVKIGVARRVPIYWVGDVISRGVISCAAKNFELKPVPVARCRRCGIIIMAKTELEWKFMWQRFAVVPSSDPPERQAAVAGKVVALEAIHVKRRFRVEGRVEWVNIVHDSAGDIIDTREHYPERGVLLLSASPIIYNLDTDGVERISIGGLTSDGDAGVEYVARGYTTLYGVLTTDSFDMPFL